jgi:kinesin family protein 18/19
MVAVRIFPISKTDQKNGLFPIVKAIDSESVTVLDLMKIKNNSGFTTNKVLGGVKEKQYAFDYVFGEDTEQKTVFDRTTKSLVEGVVDGYDATVIAYGATGAGKTYTMLGDQGNRGIYGYVFEEIFDKIV